METHQEFREFAELFLSHGVKFMIVGGYAVTAHGHPRYTGDIDFFVEKSPENAARIVKAIHEFFGPLPEVQVRNFLDEGRMTQFGVPPYRIDILTKIQGVTFEDAYPNCILSPLAGLEVPFIASKTSSKTNAPRGVTKTSAT